MTEEITDQEEQVTVGGPVTAPRPGDGLLYVGPQEDPDRFQLLDDGVPGGEGRTWRAAYRGGLNNPLVQAVKMLFPPVGVGQDWPTEADVRRWHDHAALLRHLAQPHVVQLHDIFAGPPPHPKDTVTTAGCAVAYLLMEWVEGPTLAARLRGVPVTAATLADRMRYVDDLATAVASLHSHTRSAGNPVLHRDLTPANCIVHEFRGIVLIDISGMRLVDDGFDPLGRHTPAYTAPEVLRAPHEPRDPSSDLYAVAAVALFCLTGEDPPGREADRETLADRINALLRAAGAGQPEAATEQLLRMLHPDPARRPTDVLTWCRTLTSLATSVPVSAVPTSSSVPAPSSTPTSSRVGDVHSSVLRRIPRARRRPLLLAASGVLVAAVAAVAAGGVVIAQRDGGNSAGGGRTSASGASRLLGAAPATPTTNALQPVVPASAGFAKGDFASIEGRIITPTSNQEVRDCENFTGTAKLRPGQTLVLAMHNLSYNDDFRWVQVVFGYEKPANLATWRGFQYFNDGAIGQRTLVELIELPLTKTLLTADHKNDIKETNRLAGQGRILAAVTVTRVNKKNPAFPCVPAS